jgi:hypothetical protein
MYDKTNIPADTSPVKPHLILWEKEDIGKDLRKAKKDRFRQQENADKNLVIQIVQLATIKVLSYIHLQHHQHPSHERTFISIAVPFLNIESYVPYTDLYVPQSRSTSYVSNMKDIFLLPLSLPLLLYPIHNNAPHHS